MEPEQHSDPWFQLAAISQKLLRRGSGVISLVQCKSPSQAPTNYRALNNECKFGGGIPSLVNRQSGVKMDSTSLPAKCLVPAEKWPFKKLSVHPQVAQSEVT